MLQQAEDRVALQWQHERCSRRPNWGMLTYGKSDMITMMCTNNHDLLTTSPTPVAANREQIVLPAMSQGSYFQRLPSCTFLLLRQS